MDKSILVDLRPYHVVHVHNPLTKDFTWKLARSVVNTQAQGDPYIKQLGMRNDLHNAMEHVTQDITIPSGKSMKLPGDVAQTFVKHLVDEMMQLEGRKNVLSDVNIRREYEERCILNLADIRGSVDTMSLSEQLDAQIADLNKEEIVEQKHEQAFPDVIAATGEASSSTGTTQTKPVERSTVTRK